MAASGDVTLSQDGVGNVKLHPYLITLVRWCVSCLWSTASVLLHRLVTAPLPPITATKAVPRLAPKPRQAGTEHLHPEPKVQCEVLHTPHIPTLDVIFVHGLYGSLNNTWRQGDWQTKYKMNPTKISLRNHNTNQCSCHKKQEQYINYYETNINETEINETVSFNQINGCFKKILPNENSLITEKFTNTFLNGNVNYETQAEFVSDLFKASNKTCDLNVNENKCDCVCKVNEECKLNEGNCKVNEEFRLNQCEIGCGCVCDDCYSSCWPKDWIKEDFPGARVISINYTSDPYLWRPLWVKGNKRLRLHERAEQMIEQLLALGVGQRPIIWVGHSKGGLFIKQIYCEAYEDFMRTNKGRKDNENKINNNLEDQSNIIKNNLVDNYNNFVRNIIENINETDKNDKNKKNLQNLNKKVTTKNEFFDVQNFNILRYKEKKCTENSGCAENGDVTGNEQTRLKDNEYIDISIHKTVNTSDTSATIEYNSNGGKNNDFDIMSSNIEEDIQVLRSRSSLWANSAGFMFYSVPHRGSPLAAIKTPITARSIELLEISKDCQLVLDLQDRWLVATSSSRPAVRSLVETCRTLMSVLWLRIVSVDSADAGIGSLHGVAVDHREICKPSSRKCLLYTELTGLIKNALKKCDCKNN